MIIRLTAKTIKELGLKKSDLIETEDDERLGSWFCNVILVRRRKHLLFMHSISLYAFVVPCVNKKSFSQFDNLFKMSLAENLENSGVASSVVDRLLGDIRYASTNNRSVLGSMNDMAYMYGAYTEDFHFDDMDVYAINKRLNNLPMKVLGYKNGKESMNHFLWEFLN